MSWAFVGGLVVGANLGIIVAGACFAAGVADGLDQESADRIVEAGRKDGEYEAIQREADRMDDGWDRELYGSWAWTPEHIEREGR